MARPNHGTGLWAVNGPRALAWLRAEVPRRSSLRGLPADCVRALKLPVNARRLTDWLGDTGHQEWLTIKHTLGAGNGPHGLTGPSAKTSSPVAGGPSLAEFVAAKKRAACPVCGLPSDVLAGIATASDKGFRIDEQVEWLTQGRGYAITRDELLTHKNQRHGTP